MPVASSVTREFTPTQILRQIVNKTCVLIGQAHKKKMCALISRAIETHKTKKGGNCDLKNRH